MNKTSIKNPFNNDYVINDKTIDTTKISTLLDNFSPNMKNKKKWCIEYWKDNEGYKRINDYLCRNKSRIQSYKNIPTYYNLFIDKIKENDEKIALIIECIKSVMKTAKEKDNNLFFRGDSSIIPNKNYRLETYCSITSDINIAVDFSNKLYKIIVNNNVKRLYTNDYTTKFSDEKEVLIENNCFFKFIDKDLIMVYAPNTKLEYPFRYLSYENNMFTQKTLFKINRIIEYYCDLFFTDAINDYIESFLFSKQITDKYLFSYMAFMHKLKNKFIINKDIEFVDEIDYDTFNELTKDIFMRKKQTYLKIFDTKYLPIIKRLLSNKNTPKKNK